MHIEQLYTGCLSQAAYYVESGKEAAIIDPMRDTDQYIEKAEQRGVEIKYIFETHFHADFISGHLDLARKTDAPIIFGPQATTDYDVYLAEDGETFRLGDIKLEVLHTPGHTPESVCYLLKNKKRKPHAVFTGDTLFVGDVGRPDLAAKSDLTKQDLAGMLYDSLHEKLMPLPDEVYVYPAHGAGSACGKNLGDKNWSTIGEQKEKNYALQDMTKREFVKQVIDGLKSPPRYFPLNVSLNKKGYDNVEEVLKKSKQPLSLKDFEKACDKGAIILDTRDPDAFEKGFIPGALNIGLDGRYAEWVGKLVEEENPVVLVTPPGKEEESIVRMARVGYENVQGYLKGGIKTWKKAGKPIDMVISIDAEEFELDVKHDDDIVILDVRSDNEYYEGHIDGAMNIPLEELEGRMKRFEDSDKLYVHCQTGYRSMIASSIFKKYRINNVKNIKGGYETIEDRDISQYRSVMIDN